MKYLNKQILEAIHRGINIALDDYEDEEIQSQKESKITDKNITKNIIDVYSNFVDLGLPSGTLWAKYNLGVDPKKLKTASDWYGDYYAFGEIKPKTTTYYSFKEEYTQSNGVVRTHYKKYNMTDKIMQLELCDDPAYNSKLYKKLGFDICVPTIDLYLELKENTERTWHYTYNGVGNLFVCVFTSKINGNELIFPIHGYIGGEAGTLKLENAIYGYYMSSYIVSTRFDWLYYAMQIESNANNYTRVRIDTIARENGTMVRPVLMQ